jgi:hypothetical protein
MNLKKALLPWTGAPVRTIENLHAYLSEGLSNGGGAYLPRSITLFVDPEIGETTVEVFLREMVHELESELQRRIHRRNIFVELGLFHPHEIEAFLTERTGAQRWAIYYSRSGGLGVVSDRAADASHAQRGIIPCSSMRNHGVAWARNGAGFPQVWLATSRKEGQDWDWDSDIGHESAHAAFAQVPLFLQSLTEDINTAPLSAVGGVQNVSAAHLARILYFYSELAVVAIRGEVRATQTGLPVAEWCELNALLELSDELVPEAGFRRALAALTRVNGFIDATDSHEIYEIASPIVRTIPFLTHFINASAPPDILTFRAALGSGYCG